MQLRNVLAMTRKEARTMRRDHALLSSILVQPVLYLILFGLAITNEVNQAAWIVYDQSQTVHSRQLITDLSALTALQAPRFAFSEDEVVDFLRRQDGLLHVLRPRGEKDAKRHGGEHEHQGHEHQQQQTPLNRDSIEDVTACQHHPQGDRPYAHIGDHLAKHDL